MPSLFKIKVRSVSNNPGFTWQIKICTIHVRHSDTIKSQWQKNRAIYKAYLQCGRWLNNRNLVGGRLLFWSVVGFFHSHWSVIGGRWFLWSVVGYFLGKWSVVPGRWSVVGVTVVSGLWSVAGQWAVVFYYANAVADAKFF